MSKTIFRKKYERDTTFVMQAFFSKCLLGDNDWSVGSGNPHRPLYVHYFDGVNIQFFENKDGMQWFFDELLKKNVDDKDFVRDRAQDQRSVLARLEIYWSKQTLGEAELGEYLKLVRRAAINLTFYFLSAVDERTSDGIKQFAVEIRKVDDFGAKNDGFLRRLMIARGYPGEWANVLVDRELLSVPPKEVMERRMHGVALVDGEELVIGPLEQYAESHPGFEFVGLLQKNKEVKEVRGQIAQKGNVKGRVRIVKNRTQASAVEEGDIIVSPMTTPDFIAGMHKAAAFVTDEGGIVCHAAIVAREMKKPCIIGTKIATQVFHDGDLVEVDAFQGTVTITS